MNICGNDKLAHTGKGNFGRRGKLVEFRSNYSCHCDIHARDNFLVEMDVYMGEWHRVDDVDVDRQ